MSVPAQYDAHTVGQGLAPSRRRRSFWGGFYVPVLIALAGASWAAETRPTETTILELKQLSLEELIDIEVTSVSRKEEKLFEAAAAIYVITQEDIRRSGATSIPELLRNVPGVEVARIDSHTWAITVRGFNSTAANKLLVLIDGRSVYTPLFSGVFWDVQDILLEDVDRIEVIRGPGATLWGANAVNGVINIITKAAKHTQGLFVTGGGGTEERGFGGVRYGGKLSETARYRFYAKYFSRDDTVLPDGTDAGDAWQMGQGGFRVDWDTSDKNLLTLQGDLYGGSLGQTSTIVSPTPPFMRLNNADTAVAGGNFLGRWTHHFSEASEVQLQVYYDRTERRIPLVFSEKRDTFDLDVQHGFPVGQRQGIVWGFGYRFTQDRVGNTFSVSWDPDRRATHLVSAFLQDDITLVPQRLRLTLGSKFEHNDYTGFEIQPNARLAWTPTARQTVWAAISRAVRTPTRLDQDIRLNALVIPGTPATVLAVFGSRDFVSEELLAYELGYRLQPHPRLSLDLTGFYNVYDRLSSIEGPGPPLPSPPTVTVPFTLANNLEGETYGVEVWANSQITDWWRLRTGYTYLHMQLRTKADSSDTTSVAAAKGRSPQHQFFVRSWLDLPAGLEFDTTLRYVDALPTGNVRSYVALDVRLGWRPTKDLELAVVGQNLFDNRHLEFSSTLRTEIQRGIYGKVTWRY
jgi:iron complex outermembrane recepter protein